MTRTTTTSGPEHARFGVGLIRAGVLLFLLALLIGFAVPTFANARMGLASHLEGVMNGLFLMVLGLIWPHLRLSPHLMVVTHRLAIFGTFANVAATMLAAAWGAGAPMMPLAGQGHVGTSTQELIIQVLLVSLSIAMVSVCVLVLIGLRPSHTRAE